MATDIYTIHHCIVAVVGTFGQIVYGEKEERGVWDKLLLGGYQSSLPDGSILDGCVSSKAN